MEDLNFNENGLIPAIIQDDETDQVLMLGYMNEEAYDATLRSGRVTFFSRSRQSLWTKGETSGNYLQLHEILGRQVADVVELIDEEVGVPGELGPLLGGRGPVEEADVDVLAGRRGVRQRRVESDLHRSRLGGAFDLVGVTRLVEGRVRGQHDVVVRGASGHVPVGVLCG